MAVINTYDAKSKLSELLRRARDGEEIIIAQAGIPVVRLVPMQNERGRSCLGLDAAAFSVPDDFSETLLDEFLLVRVLLDTHCLLWMIAEPERLGKKACTARCATIR